jgi:hypothetical protein
MNVNLRFDGIIVMDDYFGVRIINVAQSVAETLHEPVSASFIAI